MAGITRLALYAVVFAVIGPYFYDRFLAFREILANRPGHFTPINTFSSHEIKFQDRIRNCEDVILNEASGIAILSCDPGRDRWNTVMGAFYSEKGLEKGGLWLYDYANAQLAEEDMITRLAFKDFPGEADFRPLGIEVDEETETLYMVNHAQSGSRVEVFQLDVKAATLTYVKTVQHPLLHAPNGIHSLGGGRILVTNDHMFRARVARLLSKLETFSGLPGGSVVFTDINNPDATKVVARVPFANGITMLNSTTVAVASSSRAGVYLYELQPDYSLVYKTWFRTPAAVDNLSVDSQGVLLLAGHPSAFALMKVSGGRPFCNPESDIQAEREACECTAPTWAAQWTEKDGLTTLYKDDGFCSGCSMARDVKRNVGIISGLYGKGIFIVKE